MHCWNALRLAAFPDSITAGPPPMVRPSSIDSLNKPVRGSEDALQARASVRRLEATSEAAELRSNAGDAQPASRSACTTRAKEDLRPLQIETGWEDGSFDG